MNFFTCVLLFSSFLIHVSKAESTCTAGSCQKDCDSCEAFGKVADPSDCHRYYVCEEGNDEVFPLPFDCPDGMVFNATIHECSAAAECQSCTRCSYSCDEAPTGFISYLKSCSEYAECSDDNKPGPKQLCPSSTPYFDGTSCQSNSSLCCHCRPYCTTTGEFIADPVDCHKYHICTALGVPSGSGTCPAGQQFDNNQQTCSSEARCDPMCENFVGGDGCIDLFICHEFGFFPKCPDLCTPDYYYCSAITNTYIDYDSCPAGYVFHPDDHLCVTPDNCP